MKINQAMLESYVRNLLGQVIAAATIVSSTSGISNPINFHAHQWGLVANALWGSLVPVILRFVNQKDPAFGIVAKDVTDAATAKLNKATH
jgi:hypothetical protein